MTPKELISSCDTQGELENTIRTLSITRTLEAVEKAHRQGRLSEDNAVLRGAKLFLDAFTELLTAHKEELEAGKAVPRRINSRMLLMFDVDFLVNATVFQLLSISQGGVKHNAYIALAQVLQAQYKVMELAQKGDKGALKDLRWIKKSMKTTTHRGERKGKMANDLLNRVFQKFELKAPVSKNFTGFATNLINMFLAIRLNIRGEERCLINAGRASRGTYLEISDWFLKDYMEAIRKGLFVAPIHYPLIEKPLEQPEGGYHTVFFKYKLVTNSKQNVASSNMAINALQNTAFKIDKRILKAQKELKEANIHVGKFEALVYGKFDVPRPISTINKDGSGMSKEELEANGVTKDLDTWRRAAGAFYTNKTITNYIAQAQSVNISTASFFEDREKVYFAYYYDYRGRIYPVTSSLSPQGSSESKSLLQFAEGTTLNTPELVDEFLANGASLFGQDKKSFADRVVWSKAHTEVFLEIAENYLDDHRWAEDPKEAFMALQFCFDYKEFVEQGSEFTHYSVVPLDGTCNGLQHLAAMTHDEVSGELVNLLNTPRKDIYQTVADDLTRELQKTKGGWQAKVLKSGIITRKFCKRSVMTKPYNVSRTTVIFEHVGKQIKEQLGTLLPRYPDLIKELGEMLWNVMNSSAIKRPNQAMEWFGYVQSILFEEGYETTEWITPNGFNVSKRFLKLDTKHLECFGIMGDRVSFQVLDKKRLDKLKAKNALAPNFIHSMDAAHLQLTIEYLLKINVISFWFIHDSFGVPLKEIGLLKEGLRYIFRVMYQDADWFKDFASGLPEECQEKIEWYPEKGKLDFNEIMRAENFFA